MLKIRLEPETIPPVNVELIGRIVELLVRASGMGLFKDETIARLDLPTLRRVLDGFAAHDLLHERHGLQPLLRALEPRGHDPKLQQEAIGVLDRLLDSLEHSPLPSTEWPVLREVLGDALLCELLGTAPVSLRRYAQAARATPQTVAERLHCLAMVVSDLAGAYNPYGMRRWFERPRAALGGASPREALGRDWSVDDGPALQVRRLAAAVSGARPPRADTTALDAGGLRAEPIAVAA